MTPTKRGLRVECAACGQMKQPRGRSASMHVGSLWPGETEADFGYPCGDAGTEPIPDLR